MAQLQKSIVLTLGDEVAGLKPLLDDAVASHCLEDGGPFPKRLVETLRISTADWDPNDPAWESALERLINRVSDAATLQTLSQERGLTVGRTLSVSFVVASCDEFGSGRFGDVLRTVHRICQANQFVSRMSVYALLPGLFDDDEQADPLLYRARALALLCKLQALMSRQEQGPWKDNAPLNHIWLLDARNANGEFIGYKDVALELIAVAIASAASGDLLELFEGLSSEGNRFFSAFGCTEVRLPADLLERQMNDEFVRHVLEHAVLKRRRIDNNEVLLAAKQFCKTHVNLDEILTHLETDPDGSAYLKPFSAETEANLAGAAYGQAVTKEAERYEDRVFLEGRRYMHGRTDEVFTELEAAVSAHLDGLVDQNPGGILYAQAFLQELVGQENSLGEGPRLDEPTSLETIKRDCFNRLIADLGIQAYRDELDRLEKQHADLDAERVALQEQLESFEVPQGEETGAAKAAGKATSKMDPAEVQQALEGVEQRIDALHVRQARLTEVLEAFECALRDGEAAKKLRQQVEAERRRQLEETAEQLDATQQRLDAARLREKTLLEEQPQLRTQYFLHYPVVLAAAFVVTLLALVFSGRGSFVDVFLNRITWQTALLILLGYGVFSLYRFNRRSLAPIRVVREEITQLTQLVAALKADLRTGYAEMYQDLFQQYRDNLAFDRIQALLKDLKQRAARFESLREHLQDWLSDRRQFPDRPAGSVTRVSLFRPKDVPVISRLLLEEDLEREAARCFDLELGGRPLSTWLPNGQKQEVALVEYLQAWGEGFIRGKADILSLEDVLFNPQFDTLRAQVNVRPDSIGQVLDHVAPTVQLQDDLGAAGVTRFALGVKDAQGSQLKALLDAKFVPYSHFDGTKAVAFCIRSRFALEELSQWEHFQNAFRQVWTRRDADLGLEASEAQRIAAECAGADEETVQAQLSDNKKES